MAKDVLHHKPRYINWLLDDIGDQSGNRNANGNYALLPDYEFRTVATPGRVYQIHTMNVWISTATTGAINRVGYGMGGAGLFGQAGIRMTMQEKTALGSYFTLLDFGGNAAGQSVLFHYDWTKLGAECLDDVAMRFASPAESPWMIFRFDFVKLFGAPIVLRGNREAKLVVNVGGNNLAPGGGINLSEHYFMVRGLDYDEKILT